ncbi:MAG: hypothetical protein KAS63_07765 [Candidatus Heimdallarchaeota archaeon]|nr:hypothetical protein [Candidatus Heimdallarchaeota archaeon]MCK4955246.1 hypothetical protein [Candidatus Heimdallarchaeota archaeon]
MNENGKLCPICKVKKKNSMDKYCEKHNSAKKEMQKGYELWLKAYRVLSWDDYLHKLLNLSDSVGILVRDIAEYELYFKQN